MRRLNLHASALSDVEYKLYTSALHDLTESTEDEASNHSSDDEYYERFTVGVREVRAWLRGRYSHIPASDIDSILKLFHPGLGQSDVLTGGQFFAALRLVVHAEAGEGFDKGLAFVQAQPNSKPQPQSPPKVSQPLPPPLPPPPPAPRRPSRAASKDRNPFARHHPATQPPLPVEPSSSPPAFPTVPQLNHQSHHHKINHNPFLNRDKVANGTKPVDGKTPPLPPRKPVLAPSLPIQLIPPPRHAALLLNNPSSSSAPQKPTPPVIPAPLHSSSIHTTHITSPLMRQSLQASKAAQTMRKAEERLEEERIIQVLGKASSSHARSTSPSKPVVHQYGGNVGDSASVSGSSEGRRGAERAPPLPARRLSKSGPPSTASSRKSLEQIASASLVHSRSKFCSALSDHEITSSPPSGSPTISPTSLPSVPHPAPPTHPDRKNSDPPGMFPPTPTTPDTPASQTQRVLRARSVHHPSPPVPPRRRRPESVQLTPDGSPRPSPSAQAQSKSAGAASPAFTGLSRHLSISSHQRNGSLSRDSASTTSAPESSPMANLQRTLTSLHNKAQPKLDAARYKAEAGLLPRRGYVHHAHHSPWVEEGEQGLMGFREHTDADEESDGAGVDRDSFTDESTEEEERMRGRRLAAGWEKGTKDNLKWPAGEGWKEL